MRLLPRTPRGTWQLAGAVWLAGVGVLWWALPYRPRAAWPTEEPAVLHGFIPGTAVVLTSSPWSPGVGAPPSWILETLVARDAATGEVREWFPDGERLTLVDPGVDGKHVLIGRVVDGRARLFLHDAADGKVIAKLPPGGPGAENEFAAFCPDGRQIVYSDRTDGQPVLRVLDLVTRQEIAATTVGGERAVWSPDGRKLAYGSNIARGVWVLRLWDLAAGNTHTLDSSPMEKRTPKRMAFSPDGQTIVAELWPILETSETGYIQVVGWDVASGRERWRRVAGDASFFANLEWFATYDGWDSDRKSLFHRRDYVTGGELDLILPSGSGDHLFRPDGRLLLGTVRYSHRIPDLLTENVLGRSPDELKRPLIWEVSSGKPRFSLPLAIKGCVEIKWRSAWSADGTLLAIAGEDALAVWDMPPRKPLSWFAAGLVLFALPPLVVACRRVRQLRREAVA
jgi:dipeptidyl aminopeptidase/acylaminoacyl peptidase